MCLNYQEFSQLELSVQKVLEQLKTDATCYLGFSGGIDSTVLLSLLARLNDKSQRVVAVHINHGLHPESEQWTEHCKLIAKSYGIELIIKTLCLRPQQGQSIEALARKARYESFIELLKDNDVLLTAHHQRDQAETILLQLIRGAGPTGLASMPQQRKLGLGALIRPFLNISYSILNEYATAHELKWIDDPSNANIQFDRNYIRHQVLPILKKRWPSVERTLSRSANLCADTEKGMRGQVQLCWEQVFSAEQSSLCCRTLMKHSPFMQGLLLRKWFFQITAHYPTQKQTQTVLKFIGDTSDVKKQLAVPGYTVCCYQQHLYLVSDSCFYKTYQTSFFPIPTTIEKNKQLLIDCPPYGKVYTKIVYGQGVALKYIASGKCKLGFRQGGERVKPAGRVGSHPLKKLLQEAGVPPWLRYATPLVYYDENVIALPDSWVAEQCTAQANELGCLFYFH